MDQCAKRAEQRVGGIFFFSHKYMPRSIHARRAILGVHLDIRVVSLKMSKIWTKSSPIRMTLSSREMSVLFTADGIKYI